MTFPALALCIAVGVAALAFGVPALRRQWITRALMPLVARLLPRLGDTERVALEAGTVGWDGQLFSGSPDWKGLRRERFFGLIIPESYGGLSFSAQAHTAVVTMLASRSVTAAVTVMVPNSLGPAELLLHYGTPEQRDHYLPRLARGE